MFLQLNLIGEENHLHSSLGKLIKFAKDKGILETIINTNATNLTEKGTELINSGLDYMIYSFDGGTKNL